jgi:hypothetical protein
MALDPVVEPDISSLIESQFPLYYRDYGPVLIEFVRAYYKWAESNDQSLYHSRRLISYSDVDTTVDEFIVHFKEQYLRGIQLETTSNVRQLVKHSLDIYRSRGTERAIDLLFRLVFGVGARVYYPSTDLFRLSDGHWVKPMYLEVTLRDDHEKFVGKQVIGQDSRATAFVERVVRRKSADKFIDVLYVSSVKGTFSAGEFINASVDPYSLRECPKLLGSLSSLEVTDGASGYVVGDLVDVRSGMGYRGRGRIVAIEDATGDVTFLLVDGGYGYTVNAEVLVSNTILSVANVVVDRSYNQSPDYFYLFENVTQPMANVAYASGNGLFTEGANVYTYHGNGSVKGYGVVINSTGNTSTGTFLVSVRSGDLNEPAVYTTANAVGATVSTYTDATAQGNVMGESSRVTVVLTGVAGTFDEDDVVSQESRQGLVFTSTTTETGVSLQVTNTTGQFLVGTTLSSDAASGTVANVATRVGLVNTANAFSTSPHAWGYGVGSNTWFMVTGTTGGNGASFEVSSSLDYTETVALGNDHLASYTGVMLNAQYGFPAMASANLLTVIDTALQYENVEIGKLSAIISPDTGSDYTGSPMVRVFEDWTYPFKREGWDIDMTGATSTFEIGELVTQAATSARGLVEAGSNSTVLFLQRLSLLNAFTPTTNSTTTIVGASSGATANATFVGNDPRVPGTPRPAGWYTGVDALIEADASASDGSVTEIEVVDSGFGYVTEEEATFEGDSGQPEGTALVTAATHGIGSGYYREKGGFLSDIKKIRDGYYWQEYSYDVLSSMTLNRYKDMLREILHVAGTKAFGTLMHQSVSSAGFSVSTEAVSTTSGEGEGVALGTGTATGVGEVVILDLNFAEATELDERVTFSRASHATMFDSTGTLVGALNNVVPFSEDFTSGTGGWTLTNCTITANQAVAPDGTTTADLITPTGSVGQAVVSRAFSVVRGRGTWSCYVKRVNADWVFLRPQGPDSSNIFFNINTGTVGTSQSADITGTIEDVGDGWWRITATRGSGNVDFFFVGVCDADNSTAAVAGNTAYIWGAQAEIGRATAGAYISTTGSAYYGSRVNDYNPSTLAARGLLVEEARTNVVTRSMDTSHSDWTPFTDGGTTSNRTGASAVSPDGTTSATLHTLNRASAADWAQAGKQNFTGTAASYTASIWVKAFDVGNVGRIIDFTIRGNAAVTVLQIALPAEWTRYTITQTMFAGSCEFVFGYFRNLDANFLGTGGQTGETKFYAWGAQCELGAFATSFIPTTSAAITRAADIAVMTGTNFSNWYDAAATGTFVVDFEVLSVSSGTRPIIAADDNTANERIELYNSTADPKAIIVDGGATQADLDGGTLSAATVAKFGLSYAANDAAACLNGGTVQTDATVTLPTVDRLRLGTNQAGNYLNGHIRRVRFFNVTKSGAELQSLTT